MKIKVSANADGFNNRRGRYHIIHYQLSNLSIGGCVVSIPRLFQTCRKPVFYKCTVRHLAMQISIVPGKPNVKDTIRLSAFAYNGMPKNKSVTFAATNEIAPEAIEKTAYLNGCLDALKIKTEIPIKIK